MSRSDDLTARLASSRARNAILEAENRRLRYECFELEVACTVKEAELRAEWQEAHAELCGPEYPHDGTCACPLPSTLEEPKNAG